MRFVLKVVDSPGEPRRFVPLASETGKVVVGRDENHADELFEADEMMSRVHLAFEFDEHQCTVTDLNSTHGTYVNGQKISAPLIVTPGDDIRAGMTRFLLLAEDQLSEEELAVMNGAGIAAASAEPPPEQITAHREEEPHQEEALHPNENDSAPSREPAAAAPEDVPLERGLRDISVSELMRTEDCGLTDDASALSTEFEAPLELVAKLRDSDLHVDAIHMLSHSLEKRSAVSWACQCVRQVIPPDRLTPLDDQALLAAELWVDDPSEENRRAAMSAAEALNFDTPAAWCAVAAFWSCGSMGPPDTPAVPPAPDQTAKAVRGAVVMTSVVDSPELAQDRCREFIELGSSLANG